jgi:hypothetical protein
MLRFKALRRSVQFRVSVVSAMEPVEDAPMITGRPAHLKSRATNGRRVFAQGGDGRSPWVRRWRDLIEIHCNDCGGLGAMSEACLSLIRRANTLEIQLEQLEAKMSEGTEVDIESYSRVAGHLRRILESLGLDRKQRDATPNIADIVARQ